MRYLKAILAFLIISASGLMLTSVASKSSTSSGKKGFKTLAANTAKQGKKKQHATAANGSLTEAENKGCFNLVLAVDISKSVRPYWNQIETIYGTIVDDLKTCDRFILLKFGTYAQISRPVTIKDRKDKQLLKEYFRDSVTATDANTSFSQLLSKYKLANLEYDGRWHLVVVTDGAPDPPGNYPPADIDSALSTHSRFPGGVILAVGRGLQTSIAKQRKIGFGKGGLPIDRISPPRTEEKAGSVVDTLRDNTVTDTAGIGPEPPGWSWTIMLEEIYQFVSNAISGNLLMFTGIGAGVVLFLLVIFYGIRRLWPSRRGAVDYNGGDSAEGALEDETVYGPFIIIQDGQETRSAELPEDIPQTLGSDIPLSSQAEAGEIINEGEGRFTFTAYLDNITVNSRPLSVGEPVELGFGDTIKADNFTAIVSEDRSAEDLEFATGAKSEDDSIEIEDEFEF